MKPKDKTFTPKPRENNKPPVKGVSKRAKKIDNDSGLWCVCL